MSHQGLYLCAISLIRKLLVAWGHKLLGGCNLRSIGQVFAIRIASLITPKFVVAIKITAYYVPVVYYRKLANVRDGVRGVVYICYGCVVNFDGGPLSVGPFCRGGHIKRT